MRLLIVEDDPQLGDALASGLRQQGHVVDWFGEGQSAHQALEQASYDALILDLGLPKTDGLSWLQRWRAAGLHLPVLILTARDGVEQRVAGLDAGADDYLIKPIEVTELTARLRALLRRSTGHIQTVWTHGALQFDPASRRVCWAGHPVELTPQETALLEVLLKQPQKVLSKRVLLEQLYDWNVEEPDSNVLEVQVHHLRRKTHPGLVRTIRGVGYALGAPMDPRESA